MYTYRKRLENPDNYYITLRDTCIKLGNCWYITSNDDLFNCGDFERHNESNLENVITHMNLAIKNDLDLNEKYHIYKDLYADLKKNVIDLDTYFRFIEEYISWYEEDNTVPVNEIDYHNEEIIGIITGVISTYLDLLNFYTKVQNNCSNPVKELDTINGMVRSDLLIRCAGMHKVISVKKRLISTSDINYYNDFADYLQNHWHVDFVPPMTIQGGTLKPQEIDSYTLIRKILN